MNPITNGYNWQNLTPFNAHYFFGYHDRNPQSTDQSLNQMLGIRQCERLPLPGSSISFLIGMYRQPGLLQVDNLEVIPLKKINSAEADI